MIIKKNNFLINVAKEDKAFADTIDFVRMNKIIRDFFGIKDVPVKIKFCNSLEEFKFFFPFDFKNWICGFFDNNEVIYVFSPRIIKKAAIHKKKLYLEQYFMN